MKKSYFEFKENEVEYKLKAVKKDFKRAKITSSIDASQYARQFYHDDISIYESAFVLLTNRSNNTVGFAKISQGGIAGTVVDIKLVLKYAIENLASGIIFFHNHPSGNLMPSNEDRMLSVRIKEAAKLMDVTLIDSIILTEDSYYSFADECII